MKMKRALPLLLCGSMMASTIVVYAGEEERKTYPSTFEASGTDAEIYNHNKDVLLDFFADYYAESGELDKVAGYEEPISFTTTGWYGANTQDAYAQFEKMYGETLTQNRWLDAYKQLFNAEGKFKWMTLDTGTEYEQKIRLDMTAGDLPDIFLVRDENDLLQMAEAGIIWDMTDIVKEYATDDLKEVWESDGGIAAEKATLDGRLYGVPCKVSDTDFFSYLWLRSDWMEALGLSHPTTIEELTAIMEAFVKADFDGNGKDDTIGIVLDKDIYYSARGLFNAFGAYPEIWVEKDGAIEWGGISEENKAALQCLADWYQKGYVSSEFITQDNDTALESVLSGKCGIVYGGHWLGHTFGDLHELDENSNWEAVLLPTGNGEEVRSPLVSEVQGWAAVNSEFEHPELVLKMQNVAKAARASGVGQWWISEQNVAWNTSPLRTNVSSFDNLFTYQNMMEAYENNGDTSVLTGKAPMYWANLHGDLHWEWELMFGPGEHAAMAVLEDSYENDKLFYDAYYGAQSTYMQDRWSTIKDEQLIAFTKMITGELDIEEGFRQWKDNFNALGGERIMQEVNEWYRNK